MKISIILQFPDSERQAYIRAFSERQIDFFNEPEKAARCTISFAAVELKSIFPNAWRMQRLRFAMLFPMMCL